MATGEAMTSDVRISPISEFLRADVHGVLDTRGSREMRAKLIQAAAQHDVNRVLLDGRNARSEASTADIWTIANELGELGMSREHRIAFLLAAPREDFDRGAFLEICATNRGFQIRAFRDFEEAFSWLTTAPP